MENKYIEWLEKEIQKTNSELINYCNDLQTNTANKITNGNIVELIRASQVRLNTLKQSKEMHEVYNIR